ncbi:MAG TPA: energy transducer TonB [Candidatus Binatia bacterium]|nr:energy transducer TonB [Candidatus Binatia bacterium]
MRVASSFVLSVALHVTVLAYPVSFSARKHTEILRIAIHALEGGASGEDTPFASRNSPNGNRPAQIRAKIARSRPVEAHAKPAESSESPAITAKPSIGMSEASSALVSTILNYPETQSVAVADSAGNGGVASAGGEGEVGTGATREAAAAAWGAAGGSEPFSTGAGAESGQGSSGNGVVVTQARYRDTPKPKYPESARREGREGRVLLRVLVDDQGRSKQVEINSSSGSDVLDRAAAETIVRWRFHPARYGDQPVESWLRIPIEFRLADAKSW